jgi:amino acid permease
MAAKRYFYRLIIFYIGDILAIGVICPSNADGLMNGSGIAVSPWVIAIKRAGIHGLDSVTNAVIITSAWLSGNSYLYMSSKSFFSLAAAGNTPAIFTRCNRWGVPQYALLTSCLFAILAYMNCSGVPALYSTGLSTSRIPPASFHGCAAAWYSIGSAKHVTCSQSPSQASHINPSCSLTWVACNPHFTGIAAV